MEFELQTILEFARKEPIHKVMRTTSISCESINQTYERPVCHKSNEGKCEFRDNLPNDIRERVASLYLRENLRISGEHRQILKDMQHKIEGEYDLIMVSGVSSNHFTESQALLKNLHEIVFPALSFLKFTLVVYDLGLSEKENVEYQKYCQCNLIKFPFDHFPSHVHVMKCFGWKPLVIRAHADNSKFVMWLDASVRFQNIHGLLNAIELASVYGLQQHVQPKVFIRNPFRSLPSVFHYFGDTPCAHLAFNQVESNWGIYRRSLLVKDLILDSWVACGLQSACTCPVDQDSVQRCADKERVAFRIGNCMRPQSIITVILSKLYMKHSSVVVRDGQTFMDICRGDTEEYFKKIVENSGSK